MNLIEKFIEFLKSIFFYSSEDENTESKLSYEELKELEEECNKEDKISLAKRTLLTKLYTIEQKIAIFENEFPNEFQNFTERINNIRDDYLASLKNLEEELTFDIDPDIDGEKLGMIGILNSEVDRFIETEVKFGILSKSLQKLIMKLNILYNASIIHFKPEEKKKIISQTNRALAKTKELSKDFKNCYYIINNNQLKERIVNLLSYADYLILKTKIRNCSISPDEIIKNCVMLSEFSQFDYLTSFSDFIKDEITDLCELLPLISDSQYRKMLEKKIKKPLMVLTYSNDSKNEIFNTEFWDELLKNETTFIEMLKANGVEKAKAKVGILNRMNISIDENEVLVLPITNAYLSLTTIFGITHNEKILLLLKMLKNISKDVTYKEIYFLLVLFDLIDVIKSIPNDLLRHLEKYIEKYPYQKNNINTKKMQVINSSSKEYLAVFDLNDYEENIISILENLEFDFILSGNKVLMNSFYFNGLENILISLHNYTQNITI